MESERENGGEMTALFPGLQAEGSILHEGESYGFQQGIGDEDQYDAEEGKYHEACHGVSGEHDHQHDSQEDHCSHDEKGSQKVVETGGRTGGDQNHDSTGDLVAGFIHYRDEVDLTGSCFIAVCIGIEAVVSLVG